MLRRSPPIQRSAQREGNIDESANGHTWAMARGVGKAPPRTEHSSLALRGRRSHCLLPSILATLKTPMEHSFLASLRSGRRLKGLAARAIPDCSQRTGPGAIVQTSSVHRDQMVRTTCARCARLGSRATETGGSHRKDPCAAAHAAGTANAATPCVDAAMRRNRTRIAIGSREDGLMRRNRRNRIPKRK